MDLICPRCGSKSNELIECDDCGTIGCVRCVRKKYGRWVCFRCEEPERKYYYPTETKEESMTDALSSMFG